MTADGRELTTKWLLKQGRAHARTRRLALRNKSVQLPDLWGGASQRARPLPWHTSRPLNGMRPCHFQVDRCADGSGDRGPSSSGRGHRQTIGTRRRWFLFARRPHRRHLAPTQLRPTYSALLATRAPDCWSRHTGSRRVRVPRSPCRIPSHESSSGRPSAQRVTVVRRRGGA